MNRTALIPLAAALLVGCTTDLDGDGFAAEDDCNDENADVYPGNPDEVIGDGIDSDCDGEDPQHAYVGEWNLKSITGTAEYYGESYDAFQEYAATGSIIITPALATTLAFVLGDDDFALDFTLTGDSVPESDVGAFSLNMSGSYSDGYDTYDVSADWQCNTSDSTLTCTGPMTLDGFDLQNVAVFEKQ